MRVSTSPGRLAVWTSAPVQARRAAVSGFVGSSLEYYDFFIYGAAAALVFGTVFFPSASTGTLLAIGTLGVAYVARPLGAVVWGHIGDRYGRRLALILTIVLMGVSTFLIGCLPSFEQAGTLAPALLVVLRLLQGISAGGESPGSASLAIEHAPERNRGFFASFTTAGIMFGTVLSSLVFIPIAALPEEDLMSWGWRIPFWISAVVTVVALWLRRALEETEAFTEIQDRGERAKTPLLELFRSHRGTLIRIICFATFCMINTVVNVFGLSYGVRVGGLSSGTMLTVITAANLLAVFTTPIFGLLADHIGRRRVIICGLVGAAATSFVFFAALRNGLVPLVFLSGLLLIGVFYALPNSAGPAYFTEQFPAQVRYSGMSLGLMTGLLVAGFTPAIAEMFGPDTAWIAAGTLCAAFATLAAVAVWLGPETARVSTADLGAGAPTAGTRRRL